jgi:hypothetical protein
LPRFTGLLARLFEQQILMSFPPRWVNSSSLYWKCAYARWRQAPPSWPRVLLQHRALSALLHELHSTCCKVVSGRHVLWERSQWSEHPQLLIMSTVPHPTFRWTSSFRYAGKVHVCGTCPYIQICMRYVQTYNSRCWVGIRSARMGNHCSRTPLRFLNAVWGNITVDVATRRMWPSKPEVHILWRNLGPTHYVWDLFIWKSTFCFWYHSISWNGTPPNIQIDMKHLHIYKSHYWVGMRSVQIRYPCCPPDTRTGMRFAQTYNSRCWVGIRSAQIQHQCFRPPLRFSIAVWGNITVDVATKRIWLSEPEVQLLWRNLGLAFSVWDMWIWNWISCFCYHLISWNESPPNI